MQETEGSVILCSYSVRVRTVDCFVPGDAPQRNGHRDLIAALWGDLGTSPGKVGFAHSRDSKGRVILSARELNDTFYTPGGQAVRPAALFVDTSAGGVIPGPKDWWSSAKTRRRMRS